MDPIDEAKLLTRELDQNRVHIEPRKILVRAGGPDGFDVSLERFDDEWLVAFDGWHEHFESAEEALRCFTFGLNGPCVLKITYRGKSAVSWSVLSENDSKASVETTALVFSPFWRPKTVKLKRNREAL